MMRRSLFALGSKVVEIIGAPFSGGQGRPGVEDAPKLLEKHGLGKEVAKLGCEVTWNHLNFDVPAEDPMVNNMKRPKYVSNTTKDIYQQVSKVAKAGHLPLTVGGDHSVAIGTIPGVLSAHPDAVVLWIDAHADINTPAATLSGNLHGCPASFITRIDAQEKESVDLFSWIRPLPALDFSRLAYVGLRDVDEFEKQAIKEHNIAAYSMHDIDRHGIAKVMETAISRINPGMRRPIHLTFDVDALDPFFAPSTGTPVRGGLTWREGCYACERIAETNKLIGMDIVECNPHLGEGEHHVDVTLQSAISLVKSALGDTLL